MGGFSFRSPGPSLWRSARKRLAVVAFGLMLTVVAGRDGHAGYASIVIDARTGEVLEEVNADTLNYPASLTKMMTLYLTFDALKRGHITLTKEMYVSEHAASQPPTKLGLRPGDSLSVRDAILALVTKSANDAAVVLAEELGGTEWSFARMMTDKAAQLGMSQTVFRNASGLPDLNQVSTARDLARLSQALIHNHPEYYHFFSTESFTYKGRTLQTHNRFMKSYEGADGIKTGYTRASGFNLAASVKRDGRRLIAVVMGGESAQSRDLQMASLFDRSFGPAAPGFAVASAGRAAVVDTEEPVGRHSYRPDRQPQIERVAYAPEPEPRSARSAIAAAKRAATPAAPAERGGPDKGNSDKGSWAIQVGVFSDMASAKRVAQEAARLLPNLPANAKVGVTSLQQSGKRLYRARLTGISRTAALDACKLLERKKRDCMALDTDA